MKKILILLSISLLTITMITRNVTLAQNETTSEVVPTITEEVAAVEEEKPTEIEATPEAETVIEQTEVPADVEGAVEAEAPTESGSEAIVEEENKEYSEIIEGELPEGELSEEELPEGELSEEELPEGELPQDENSESKEEQDSSEVPLGMVGLGSPVTQALGAKKELIIRADDVFVINGDEDNIWEQDGDVYFKKQERFSDTPMSPSITIISEDELKEKNRFYSYDGEVSYKYINSETGEELEGEPSQPGSYEKIANVTVKYNYLVIKDSYDLETSVKFRIEGIKVVNIINDETVTYTGEVVTPKLYAVDTGNNKIALEYGKDYYLTKTLLGGEVNSVDVSEHNYYAYAVFTQEFRNQHWSFDWDADKDLFVQLISYKIEKRKVNVSYDKEFEFDKCYITPNIFAFDNDANNIVIDNCDYQIVNVTKKDGTIIDPDVENVSMDVGTYTAKIKFSNEFLKNNSVVANHAVKALDDGNYQIEYKITKKNIKFDSWNASVDPITTEDGKVFNWEGEDGDAKLVFNGYNPTLYNAFPTANFVDLYGDPIDDADLTFTVRPTSFLDGIGHHLVNIDLNNDNYRLIGEGGFTIVKKPVMIKWDNTVIDVKSHDKVPNAKIVEIDNPTLSGVVASDEGKIFIDYDYYRIVNGYPIKVLIPPTEEGDYIVEAKVYNKGLVPTLCLNYSYGDTYQTRYQIVDMSTSHEGDINTGTINKIEEDVTLDLLGFDEGQAQEFVNNLPNQEIKDILNEALEHGKDINLYIVATDADASSLTLPDGVLEDETICIDIQLFATVEGDTNKYQIEDTGAYPISILFTVTPEEAEKIGYNSNKLFYVARYHGTDTANPVVSQENPTIDGDGNFQFVYQSNKFSDFVVYTKNKPVAPVVRKTSHTVINTGD